MTPAEKIAGLQSKNFTVLRAGHPSWQADLLQQLQLESSISFNPTSADPLINVLTHADLRGCKAVLLERNYVDEDYLDEYVNFYCRTFTAHPSSCIRIHFFSGSDKLDIDNLAPYQDHYIGYTVLRPISASVTGRTVLKPKKRQQDREEYVNCISTFKANVLGTMLTIRGAPFTQQDTNVGACAQAALWMTALYMHAAYGTTRFHPAEISDYATQYLPSAGARHGLLPDQMIEAIRSMNFQPARIDAIENETGETGNLRELSQFIYAYSESKIPVILGMGSTDLEGHAVMAIGHNYDDKPIQLTELDKPIISFHCGGSQPERIPYSTGDLWLKQLIVNDDAVGPYREMDYHELLRNVVCAFAPTPAAVNLTAGDAELHTRLFLGNVNALFEQANKFSKKELQDFTIRLRLVRATEYKATLRDETTMAHELQSLYRTLELPKFIWVAELHEGKRDGVIRGELLIDSTANPFSHISSVVAFHLRGRVWYRNREMDPDDFRIASDPGYTYTNRWSTPSAPYTPGPPHATT